jgi:predicted nuclease of predicted toxin-antitoxin system
LRFFVDECISPSLSRHLNATGLHDAIHPRDRGRLGEPDHVVFARAIAEDRIIVTENAEDFRRLAVGVALHPGLIILPSVARLEAQRLMDRAVAYLLEKGSAHPENVLVNAVLIVTDAGDLRIEPLP